MSILKDHFDRIRRFSEGRGFPLLTVICVAVITATAVWTGQKEPASFSATPPPSREEQAAALYQQSLSNVNSPTPLPTLRPQQWTPPLDQVEILRPFSADTMVTSGVPGLWSLHLSADLQAEAGAPVYAMEDGEVIGCGDNALDGTWIEVEHQGGCVSRYASLSLINGVRPGDQVKAGQTIGFAGNTALNETDLGPHLHLQFRRDGLAVDPITLLQD